MNRYQIELVTEFEQGVDPFYWVHDVQNFAQKTLVPGASIVVEHSDGVSVKITNLGSDPA